LNTQDTLVLIIEALKSKSKILFVIYGTNKWVKIIPELVLKSCGFEEPFAEKLCSFAVDHFDSLKKIV
jgi:hypothetical protein